MGSVVWLGATAQQQNGGRHEALRFVGTIPCCCRASDLRDGTGGVPDQGPSLGAHATRRVRDPRRHRRRRRRSEEHTSELQSHVNLVCRLLLEKKKNNTRSTFLLNKKKK